MRILATLDDPTEGNAYINGVSLVDDPESYAVVSSASGATRLPAHRDMTVHDLHRLLCPGLRPARP